MRHCHSSVTRHAHRAVFFSCIYGNIAQTIASLGEAGQRYRQRMGEIDQFAKAHRITAELQRKLRHYVHFQWSVTHGLEVDAMAGGLPAHLTLEVRMQLYMPMVRKVTIFAGCPAAFFEQLTSKLSPLWIPESYFVFYEGESGHRMFFIQRGTAHVQQLRSGLVGVLTTLKEGGYFGELSLLLDQPRSTDVLARTDLMLLALTRDAFFGVLQAFPEARVAITAAAEKKAKRHVVVNVTANQPRKHHGSPGLRPGPGTWGASSQARLCPSSTAVLCIADGDDEAAVEAAAAGPTEGHAAAGGLGAAAGSLSPQSQSPIWHGGGGSDQIRRSSAKRASLRGQLPGAIPGAGVRAAGRVVPSAGDQQHAVHAAHAAVHGAGAAVDHISGRRPSADETDRIRRPSPGFLRSGGAGAMATSNPLADETQLGGIGAIAALQASISTLTTKQSAMEQMLREVSRQLEVLVGNQRSSSPIPRVESCS